MAKLASNVVKQCNEWLGYNEADGSFKVIIDTYNSHNPKARGYTMKYSDEWCSCFVSAVAIKLGYTDIIPIEVGCEKHVQLFKAKGIWIENDAHIPKIGDILLYDWNDNGLGDNVGSSDHIGYVVSVGNGTFTVIEGNYSQKVTKRTMSVNGRYIRGFASPKYDAETQTEKTPIKYNYKVGDTITINGVYSSSNSDKKLTPLRNTGKITSINEGSKNPYLLDYGNLGWVNESVIIGVKTANSINLGDNVKVTSRIDYNGTTCDRWVLNATFKVKEISKDRVVLTRNGAVIGAWNINDIIKI